MKCPANNNTTFEVILGVFFSAVVGSLVRADTCDQKELLGCAYPLRVLSTGNKNLGFAENKEELDQLCPELTSGLRCIDSYTLRCMPSDMRNQFNRLYSGTKMVIEDLCREGPYQQEFLLHAPCMRKVKTEYEECATHYTQMIQSVNSPDRKNATATQAEGMAQMRTVCCSFQDYLSCSEDIVLSQCGPVTANFTQRFLDRMSSSLIKDHCVEFLPTCGDAISGAFNSSAVLITNWTLLLAIVFTMALSYSRQLT